MKLKLEALPGGNRGPLIINLVYGQDSEGNGGRRFIQSVAVGSSLDVSSEIGNALLGQYGSYFRVAPDAPAKAESAPALDKDNSATPAKKTKDIDKPAAAG